MHPVVGTVWQDKVKTRFRMVGLGVAEQAESCFARAIGTRVEAERAAGAVRLMQDDGAPSSLPLRPSTLLR